MRIQPLWEKQTIYQGATWQPYWVVKDADGNPVDLTLWTARCVVGSDYGVAIPDLELTTENAGVVLTDVGEVSIYATAEVTAALTASTTRPSYYEVELIEPGGEPVHRIVYGPCIVDPEVKRDYV